MKDFKLKCQCYGGETLYVGDFGDGQMYVAIDREFGRKNKKKKEHLPEVIVIKKELLKLLK